MVFAVSGRLRFSQFLAGFLVGVLASSTVAVVNRDSQLVVAEDTAAPSSTAVIAGETTAPTTTVSPDTTIAATTTSASTTTTTVVTRRDIRVLTSLRVKKRVAFITIDDGGYISPSVVSYLNKNKIPVTRFVAARSLSDAFLERFPHCFVRLLPSLKWVMEELHADNLRPAFLSDYLKYG